MKLPSGKLQLNKQFTVGNGSEADFVFDVTVVKAGKSGKYVLKPVVGESSTDVPLQTVDEAEDEDEDEVENESDIDASADALNATFVGDVTRGENATVQLAEQALKPRRLRRGYSTVFCAQTLESACLRALRAHLCSSEAVYPPDVMRQFRIPRLTPAGTPIGIGRVPTQNTQIPPNPTHLR